MRLYNSDTSPFAARCRLAIYRKGLAVEIVPPPESNPRSDAYRAINPIGKVPALVLDDGRVIPESAVIVEYLEDRFPSPSLLPGDAEARARTRLLARLPEVYLMPPMGRIFRQIMSGTREEEVIGPALAEIDANLDLLELFTADGGWAAGAELSLADCALVPILFYVRKMSQAFGQGEALVRQGRLRAYWARAEADPVVARVAAEMEEGLRRLLASR